MIVSLMVIAAALLLGLGLVYSGIFNVAADEPHWAITGRLIERARERSIHVRAHHVAAPATLDDPELLAMGAEHYAEMCTGCHLAPGMNDTELRAGLYPKPPNLAEHDAHRSAGENFWIIKHGLKMTGMPAWGVTHDDRSVWGMVAFLQRLPTLSRPEYEALVAQGRDSGHAHDGEDAGDAQGQAEPDAEPQAGDHEHEDGHSHLHD